MYIKDLQTGTVREYGSNHHDSLAISSDGRTLGYYNLQNGDGSRWGDYRFCDESGNTPEEDEGYAMHGEAYFNIGGWDNPADVLNKIKREIKESPDMDIKAVLDILERKIKEYEE